MTSPMFSVMVNGSLEGFFSRRKGLWQGDPLSPFLFMIMMEVLSKLLNRTPNGFQFLHRYEKIRLTHLDFVDDLIIFCRADRCSLQFVKDILEYYEGLSGLKANIGKSSMFVAGVGQVDAMELSHFMDFSLGTLFVRYLGLPLLSSRLCASDCGPLIQKIIARIRSWSTRSLSYVECLQLVRSVL